MGFQNNRLRFIDSDKLKVPHPGISSRAFVLLPLLEVAPVLEVPGLGQVKDLVRDADVSSLVTLEVGWARRKWMANFEKRMD